MTGPSRTVLNVGCGELVDDNIHPVFRDPSWKQVRFDINPDVQPDVLGSLTNVADVCPHDAYDAIWCSHSLEHLFAHEVDPALHGLRRVLKPAGFLVVTCPDIEAIIAEIAQRGLDEAVYLSPAGPINSLDMLFGHTGSIAQGNEFMAHRTGFTAQRLASLLLYAGFHTAILRRRHWDLWALGLREEAAHERVRHDLAQGGLDVFL